MIFCAKDGRPSMKLVYSQMNTGTLQVLRRPRKGKPYIRLYTNNNVETLTKQPVESLNAEGKILIRWGNRVNIPTNNHSITYNCMDGIKNATDKKLARQILIDKNINCPKLVNPQNIQQNQLPIIARPFVHSKGRNFVTLSSIAEFVQHYNRNSDGWYYSEFIDKEREFRVHCAHGKVLAVMEKPRGVGIAWNRAQNHEAFVRVKQEDYNFQVCLQALKATEALGLDFAGVDVLFKNNNAYVVEANTSPTLNSSEYVSKRYAHYFNWLFRQEQRRESWKYLEYKKAKSFAWTENQLAQ